MATVRQLDIEESPFDDIEFLETLSIHLWQGKTITPHTSTNPNMPNPLMCAEVKPTKLVIFETGKCMTMHMWRNCAFNINDPNLPSPECTVFLLEQVSGTPASDSQIALSKASVEAAMRE
ncbi:uncharacterized protein MELLADRAFT_109551 [Melampsora larici-populina 98AG31]|uniref:Uncharacterized protein n=1 Tax=Melampsora larici-populina (strain 98AG31 / pathotype 3-4-7) TaxID=747676 RepID=F4RWU7_MELLP|nr:uncharacterized protein MELLADRAFT_109551 [Melampsora larici-populina 98AG31]EGG03086.1 hypothetical protein MELLADRAFT_109551 [Melampsora larici-populina 98AG31]